MEGSARVNEPTGVRLHVIPVPDADGEETLRVLAAPDPCYVSVNGTLAFVCDHPFNVVFEGASPLASGSERQENGRTAFSVRADAARVEPYKYTVNVFHESGGVLTADPEAVVEPDPPIKTAG